MNFKFRITKYLAVSALAVLLLGACSKNNIYMDVAYPNGEENSGGEEGNNDNPDKKDALITFSASVEGRNITRAMSPMGKGLQSWLCAYPSNTTNTIEGEPVGEGNYITSSPGVLTGIQSYKMYLSNDIYSFYAVSCNSSNPAPTFTNGKSEALSNGVDYLWWHALHQDVTSSQVNIPITYQHVATQVVITITGVRILHSTKYSPPLLLPRNRELSWICQQGSFLQKSVTISLPTWESMISRFNISCFR